MSINKALLQIEAGATLVDYVGLTDSGDHTVFTFADNVVSNNDVKGRAPIVRPDGIVTGIDLVAIPASGTSDVIDTQAFSCYVTGTLLSVAADTDVALTRPATNVSQINSITVTDAGAIAVVAGTDGSTTTFSEVRGAAGGPPLIPTTSIEIGQVRMVSSAAALITADEIFGVPNQHAEYSNFPDYKYNLIGEGAYTETTSKENAYIEFFSALPLIHTGVVPKNVYVKYYTPTFSTLELATAWQPPELSYSTNSIQTLGDGSLATTAESLGQGSFTVTRKSGVEETIVQLKGQNLTYKFFPDRNKTPYQLCQGTLGISRPYAPGARVEIACTVSPEVETADFIL